MLRCRLLVFIMYSTILTSVDGSTPIFTSRNRLPYLIGACRLPVALFSRVISSDEQSAVPGFSKMSPMYIIRFYQCARRVLLWRLFLSRQVLPQYLLRKLLSSWTKLSLLPCSPHRVRQVLPRPTFRGLDLHGRSSVCSYGYFTGYVKSFSRFYCGSLDHHGRNSVCSSGSFKSKSVKSCASFWSLYWRHDVQERSAAGACGAFTGPVAVSSSFSDSALKIRKKGRRDLAIDAWFPTRFPYRIP